ncbi:MAG: hypothetical protein ABWX84_13450 [Nocardioides sp.]
MATLKQDAPDVTGHGVLDAQLPVYDVVLTEHLIVDAEPQSVFVAAKEFDFLTVRAPLVTTLMTLRGLPARLRGRPDETPAELRLAAEPGALPGWLLLGEVAGREVAFGAVGKFWKADIEWRDVPVAEFAGFCEPGWGKIACHLLVRPDGAGRSILTYECRTGTTDLDSRREMSRYWWLIRPFVGYILRAVLRTIRADAETAARA